MLAVRRKQSELDKVVEALIFSLFLYLCTLPFFGYSLPLSWRVLDASHPDIFQVVVQWPHLAILAVLSLFFGIAYATYVNYDLLARILFKFGSRIRSSRVNIWNEAFEELKGFVQVDLSGGRRVIGWVRNFSDEENVYELFLEDAAWVDEKGDQQPINGPGILLTKDSGIEFVTFLYEDETVEKDENAPAGTDS